MTISNEKLNDNKDFNIDTSVQFIKAKTEDSRTWCQIKQMAWNQTYRNIYPDEMIDNFDFEAQNKKFLADIDNKDINLYFICVNGEKVGYFNFGKSKYEKTYPYSINSLYILKDYKRMGIGTKVFDFVKNYFSKQGIHTFSNGCNYYNENAQKFYKKMGGEVYKIDANSINKRENQICFKYEI